MPESNDQNTSANNQAKKNEESLNMPITQETSKSLAQGKSTETIEAVKAEFPQLTPNQKGSVDFKIAPLMGVHLKVSVLLGETTMSLGDLLKLGTGSVIELNTSTGDPIEILVNDKTFAKGEVVVVDESFGIRIVEILDSERMKAA